MGEPVIELAHPICIQRVISFIIIVYTIRVSITPNNMFKTNGSTHHQGVSNEHATIDILNEFSVYDTNVTHKGGTKHKADAVAGEKGISIKHKAGLKNGSFDWVNTSQINDVIDRTCFENFFTFLKGAHMLPKEDRKALIDQARDLFNDCCEKALNTIDPYMMLDFMRTHVVEKQRGYGIVINDTKHEMLHIMEADRLTMTECIKADHIPQLVRGKGKSSRRMLLNGSFCSVDLGLRVRVTSNNGIKAFLGLSKANKSSQIVIKIQQDNVRQFVTTDPNRMILTYAS